MSVNFFYTNIILQLIVEHFKKELIEYLSWYNGKRIKVKLKGLTPLQFRNQPLKSAWLKCPIIGVHFKVELFFCKCSYGGYV